MLLVILKQEKNGLDGHFWSASCFIFETLLNSLARIRSAIILAFRDPKSFGLAVFNPQRKISRYSAGLIFGRSMRAKGSLTRYRATSNIVLSSVSKIKVGMSR